MEKSQYPHFLIASVWLILLSVHPCSAQISSDSPVKVISIGEFVASADILSAGIHDSVSVSVVVDESGKVKKIDFLTGPMWPCNSDPRKELARLRESITALIRAAKFEPAKVKRNPVTFEGTFEFKVANSQLEIEALDELAAATKEISLEKDKGSGKTVYLKLGRIRLHKQPEYSASVLRAVSYAEVEVRYLVDKNGKVVSAGIIRGPKLLHIEARDTVCKSEFEPTVFKGRSIPTIQTRTFTVNGGILVIQQ